MVVILRAFSVSVEDLGQRSRLPSVDELRPACCPLCDEPCRGQDGGLRIVGHGTYRRQALGLPGGCREVLVWIRRFLCLACRRTISVLPDGLYPGRWYSAIAILTSLVLAVLGGVAAGRVRERFTGHPARDWRTLDRWQEQLLAPLWGWLAGQLGFSQPSDSDVRQRLQRLLMLQGVSGTGPPEDLEEVARAMLCETAHCGGLGWEMRRGRPWDGSGGGPAGV